MAQTRYKEVPTWDEMPAKLNEANNKYWKTIAQALYYTGARAGELVQIRKKHVWEEEAFVKVKLLTEKNRYQTERIIPIPKKIEPLGASLFLSLCEMKQDSDLLFPPTPGVSTPSFLRVMRRDINWEYDGVAPHFFRHCRLTHMVTRFAYDSHQLVKFAGWSDERPAKHYVHLRTEDLEAKML